MCERFHISGITGMCFILPILFDERCYGNNIGGQPGRKAKRHVESAQQLGRTSVVYITKEYCMYKD